MLISKDICKLKKWSYLNLLLSQHYHSVGRLKNLAIVLYRSRIHERTLSLEFLGMILRVLRFLDGFLKPYREGHMVFYQVFLLSLLQCTV
jgi:hypothetical protein